MLVTLDEVKELFKKLIEETVSRDEVEKWADIRQQENDYNQLDFLSEDEYLLIWETLLYFSSVDLKIKPDEYFFEKDYFIQNFFDLYGHMYNE